MKLLALGLTLGILARSWALVSHVKRGVAAEYPWLAMFFFVGCCRSAWLCWLLVHGGAGYNLFMIRTTGLMQLLVLAVVLEAAWKLMRSVERGK